MKTVKILATIWVVVLISGCASFDKQGNLHSNLRQKPVPVKPGPMTHNPNSLGLPGPGCIISGSEGWKIKQKRTRKNPNSQGRISKVNRKIAFVENIPSEMQIQISFFEAPILETKSSLN